MIFLAKMIGMIALATGVLCLVHPSIIRRLIDFWVYKDRLYYMGGIRIVVGFILILAAGSALIPWVVYLIGVIPMIGGILIFALGLEKNKEMIAIVQSKPNKMFRAFAAVPIAMGGLLILAL